MKTPFLAVTLLAFSTSFANAEVNSLSGKVMNDLVATKSGTTTMPTAQPDTGSIAHKIAKDRLGLNVGSTSNPLAKSEDQSLSSAITQNLNARS